MVRYTGNSRPLRKEAPLDVAVERRSTLPVENEVYPLEEMFGPLCTEESEDESPTTTEIDLSEDLPRSRRSMDKENESGKSKSHSATIAENVSRGRNTIETRGSSLTTQQRSTSRRKTLPPSTATPASVRSTSRRRKSASPKKSSSKVLEQIVKLQNGTQVLIPKIRFARLIREVLQDYHNRGLRVTPMSLMCLQEAAETYLTQLMEDSYRCTMHRDRITLKPKDMRLALMLRNDSVMMSSYTKK